MTSRAQLAYGLRLALVVACALPAALPACSYSTKRLTGFPSARTIAVVPFANIGFRRDLEQQLTYAVVNEIRARGNLAFATPTSADLVLTGSTAADETALSLDGTGAAIQKRLAGQLTIQLTDRVSGRVLREATVLATEEFRPGVRGESLDGTATDEWARRLAEQIVQQLEVGF